MTSPAHTPDPSRPHTPENFDKDADYLAKSREVAQLFTPSKSTRQLENLQTRLLAQLDGAAHQAHLKRSHDNDNDERPSKRHTNTRGHRTAGISEEDVDNADVLETKVRSFGRRFVLQYGVWLSMGTKDVESFFRSNISSAPSLDSPSASETLDALGPAQLKKIREILPEELQEFLTHSWLAQAFDDGMSNQRSNCSTRLRGAALSHILADTDYAGCDTKFRTPESRHANFAEFIGWRSDEGQRSFYSAWKVPLLHDGSEPSLDYNKVFRNIILLKVHAALIRGPSGADGLLAGNSSRPRAKCMESMHHIRQTTPSAIASSAVLAIWLFSSDKELTAVGTKTGIKYAERFRTYLHTLNLGLSRRPPQEWAQKLFAFWDETLFPQAGESILGASKSDSRRYDEAEDEEALALLDDMPAAPSNGGDNDGDGDGEQ